MLGTNKWRLLSIVAGLLLAHAIDSPAANPPRTITHTPQPFAAPQGVTLQQFYPSTGTSQSGRSTSRNLYQPYDAFSKIDNVRFTDKRETSNRGGRQLFGSFRYTNNGRRRSDSVQTFNSSSPAAVVSSSHRLVPRSKPQYSFIPLNQFKDPDAPSNTLTERSQNIPTNVSLSDEIQPRTDINIYAEETRSKIVFPSESANAQDITGRRSGIQFAAQSQKLEIPFQPQGYREDNPTNPNYQFPYSEELSQGGFEPDTRYTRGISFEQQRVPSTAQQHQSNQITFRDDVTKFGDVNGPVTSLQQRQYSDYSPFTSRPFDSGYYTSSYDEFSRSPRYYSPPPAAKFVEYSDYPGPPRSRLITPWKSSSRTPRVVFPQTGDDGFPTGSASGATGGSYNSDNVVFRYALAYYDQYKFHINHF